MDVLRRVTAATAAGLGTGIVVWLLASGQNLLLWDRISFAPNGEWAAAAVALLATGTAFVCVLFDLRPHA